MYCPNCGTNLNDKAQNFCPNCGAQISNIVKAQPKTYQTVPVQAAKSNIGRPGPHSQKCLEFAIASLIIGIATAVVGLILIIILRIVGSIILLIIHIVGLSLGISGRNHCNKASESEPSNPHEKSGSVIVIFGIVINIILMVIDIIFTLIFLIVIGI